MFFPIVIGCSQKSTNNVPLMVNGISFVAAPNPAQQVHVDAVLNVNANYAAVMPFGFIRDLATPEIVFDTERQWFGETKAGAKQYIEVLHGNQLKVMMKPQIWIWRGEFTGYLKMNSEEEWKTLEDSYRKFIMAYVKLAHELNVEIFCIGTELEQFIVNRPGYWNGLISEIKTIYKGKLTYAANWDEYKRVPFWKELDFIGVDAYFPISENQTPTVEDAKLGWQQWKEELKSVSERENKKILFTEYGYRSVDFAGNEPWKSNRDMTEVNLEAQTNLTQGLFDEVYRESWYAGGFIWKWYLNHGKSGGEDNSRFTPQNKPAEILIREHFRTNN
ncbi:MAG: glycoside hydrolase [Flavobacteriaceae bacterium]|nr:glycoside hydrolase [Flavobacteriaceae bacterium]